MRILHLEDEPWDSGMAHYAVTLAAEQRRRGHEVALWGRAGSPVLAAAAAAGVETRGFDGGPLGLLSWPTLRSAAAAFGPRVIDAHTGSSHTLALFLAERKPFAVVRTRGDARAPKANALTTFVARRTSAFVGANRALATALKAAFPFAKVAAVPQGIEAPAKPAPLPAEPVVGMLARFDPVKGHDVLLDAAAKLKTKVPGLRVRCAGTGRLLERLKWQLKPDGLEGVVSFEGRVPDAWSFAAACRVGVVPSLGSEAVSRAALEWMAMGRPVVASAVGGLPELVEDGVTGLVVPPGDPAALAAALGSLLSDPARAEKLGAAGRSRFARLFSLGVFYENTQKVYDEATRHLPS